MARITPLQPLSGQTVFPTPETVSFVIRGEPASKANSRAIVAIKGKPSSIKSQKARSFEAVALLQIPPNCKVMLTGPVRVDLAVYYASRRPDLDESVILDVLQARYSSVKTGRKLIRAGVYINDRQVAEKHVYKRLDPADPRTVISVTPLAAGCELCDNTDPVQSVLV